MAELTPARSVGRPRIHEADPGYYSEEAIVARRTYQTRYKTENREAIRSYYRAWRESHRDLTRADNRAWLARKKAAASPIGEGVMQRAPEVQAEPEVV